MYIIESVAAGVNDPEPESGKTDDVSSQMIMLPKGFFNALHNFPAVRLYACNSSIS